MNTYKTDNNYNKTNNKFVKKVVSSFDNLSKYWQRPNFIQKKFKNSKIIFIDDTVQKVGNFKIRGVTCGINNVLDMYSEIDTIVCASSGSFGISTARVCQKKKINSEIFIPKTTSKFKKEKILSYGSIIHDNNKDYDEAKENANKYANTKKNYFYFDGCREDVMYGNGSLIIELLNKFSKKEKNFLDRNIVMILPLGIGSLATPCTILLKHYFKKATVIISEPTNYCKFFYTFNNKYKQSFKKTIAEGIAVKKIPEISFNILKKSVDYVSTVSEKEIIGAINYLFSNFNIKSEGAGAITTACFIYNQKFFENYDYVIIPICGNNIDDKLFEEILY